MLNKLDLPTWVGDALKGMAFGGLIFLGLALLPAGLCFCCDGCESATSPPSLKQGVLTVLGIELVQELPKRRLACFAGPRLVRSRWASVPAGPCQASI